MKVGVLLNSVAALNILMEKPLKAAVSFRLSKFLKEASECEKHFNKAKQALFDQYGEVVDGTETIRIKEDHLSEFSKQLDDLLDEDVDIKLPNIKIDDLGNIEIEAKVLLQLDWLIFED